MKQPLVNSAGHRLPLPRAAVGSEEKPTSQRLRQHPEFRSSVSLSCRRQASQLTGSILGRIGPAACVQGRDLASGARQVPRAPPVPTGARVCQSLGAEGTKERVGSPRQQVGEPFCQGFAGPHGSGSRAAAARGGEAEPWPAGSAAPGRSGAGGGCAGARSAGLDPVRCARSNVTLQGEMELF